MTQQRRRRRPRLQFSLRILLLTLLLAGPLFWLLWPIATHYYAEWFVPVPPPAPVVDAVSGAT